MNQHSNKKLFLVSDFLCITIIIGIMGYTFYAITQMPDTIPIHWSIGGVVDGWGSKWISLLYPGLILFVYVLSFLYIKYLKKHNYSIMAASLSQLGFVIFLTIMNLSFIQSALG